MRRICQLGIIIILSWAASVRAEGVVDTPLAAMREAAQAVVSIDPDDSPLAQKQQPTTRTIGNAALRNAIHAAIHGDVERAAGARTPTPGRAVSATAAGGSNANAASDHRGPSETGQLNSAAMSAQQAKHHVVVQAQKQGEVAAHGNTVAVGKSAR